MKALLSCLLSIFLVFSCFAIAEKDSCPHTDTFEWIEGQIYESWSPKNHQVLYGVNVQCEDCGKLVNSYGESFFQPHEFIGHACIYCGYTSNDLPSPSELQKQAYQRITQESTSIIGMKATVIHDGKVRKAPDANAEAVDSVLPKEQYLIADYAITDSDHVWLLLECGTQDAWISAGLVSISGAQALKDDADLYIGRSCTVKVSSGRGRRAPGTDSAVIDFVGYGDTFTIIGSDYAPDGTLWLQIETSNGSCWISSGLVNIR